MRNASFPSRQNSLTLALIILLALVIVTLLVAFSSNLRHNQKMAEVIETYKPHPLPTVEHSDPVTVAFLGDSYTAGSGASTRAQRWTTLLSQKQGWLELNYGVGGTNFGSAGSWNNGLPYPERLTDLIISQPDIVVVSSAGNALGVDHRPGIDSTFAQLREELPDARIIALSPFRWKGQNDAQLESFADEMQIGVEAVDGQYVEIGHPLEQQPKAIAKDEIHPNDFGHQILSDAVADALK